MPASLHSNALQTSHFAELRQSNLFNFILQSRALSLSEYLCAPRIVSCGQRKTPPAAFPVNEHNALMRPCKHPHRSLVPKLYDSVLGLNLSLNALPSLVNPPVITDHICRGLLVCIR